MIGMPATYVPSDFIVINPPHMGWLRRTMAHKPDIASRLFVYYAVHEGNYVIGLWTDRWKRKFWDVINMGPTLEFSPEDAAHLRRMLDGSPLTGTSLSKLVQRAEHERLLELENYERDFGDYMRWSMEYGRREMVSLHGT